VQLDELSREREAQAGALPHVAHIAPRLLELLEDQLLVLWSDPGARIRHGNLDRAVRH
jgi:hypothetical protein